MSPSRKQKLWCDHSSWADEVLMTALTIGIGAPVAALVRLAIPEVSTFWLVTIAFVAGAVAAFCVRKHQERRRF